MTKFDRRRDKDKMADPARWLGGHAPRDDIKVKRIDTEVQKGDIFTKGLRKKEFEEKRKMILGW